MIPMRVEDIAAAAGARLLPEGGKPSRPISEVSTDTRTLKRGALFAALKGDRYDAHDFLDRALDGGAAALLVARARPEVLRKAGEKGAAVLRARSTLAALSRLAAKQRDLSRAVVVGITGSTGKTLTKDFAAAVLGTEGKVTASRGSYNNEVGVPLTILELDADTRFLILEMGSRGKGHIEELCAYARPQVGVITNIGWTHMQFFRTRDNLARAKAELLQSLPPDGWAVINASAKIEMPSSGVLGSPRRASWYILMTVR